jgi:L-arabinose isomerase
LHDLKNAHLGHIGHPINSMMDMNTDPTMLTSFFGSHIVECEANELMASYDKVKEEEILKEEVKILDFFDTPDPVSDPISMKLKKDDLRVAAHVSVALKKFINEKGIDGLSYYYEGRPKFIIAEGESVKGPIPPTGNTNTRGFFKPDVRTFLKRWNKEGPTHHFALGIGHHASTIEKIADYLNIESVIIPND